MNPELQANSISEICEVKIIVMLFFSLLFSGEKKLLRVTVNPVTGIHSCADTEFTALGLPAITAMKEVAKLEHRNN